MSVKPLLVLSSTRTAPSSFFFSYGALDRYGSGRWTLENDTVRFQSRAWAGSDFARVSSSTSGNGITIRIADKNPMIVQHVFASLRNGQEGSFQMANSQGEIQFPATHASMITLAFEFCPERFSFIPITNAEHNYFEFKVEPWIMEVFFDKFSLKLHRHYLAGKHPLLRGEEFVYEKV